MSERSSWQRTDDQLTVSMTMTARTLSLFFFVVVSVGGGVSGVGVTSAAAAAMVVVVPDATTGRRNRRRRRKIALVTGSTDGIGLTTAKHLAANHHNDYTVLIHGRDEQRISNAVERIQKFCRQNHQNNNNNGFDDNAAVIALPATDISSIKGCYELVDHVRDAIKEAGGDGDGDGDGGRLGLGLSVLMNNAGVYSERLERTQDGLEMTFAVNVLAPFIITSMLLPELVVGSTSKSSSSSSSSWSSSDSSTTATSSRIVIASSISQSWSPIDDWDDIHLYHGDRSQSRSRSRSSYSAHRSYSESKLLDAMLTMEFHERLMGFPFSNSSITCNCLDPGTVNTKMLLAGWGRIGIDVREALDQTWLCTSPEVEGVSGKYFVNQCECRASSPVYDIEQRQQLWNLLSTIAPDAAAMWSKKEKMDDLLRP